MSRSRYAKVQICKADILLELLEDRVMFDAAVDQDQQVQDQHQDVVAVGDQSTQSGQTTQSAQATQGDAPQSGDQSQTGPQEGANNTPWVQQPDGTYHRVVGDTDEWWHQTGDQTYYFLYDNAQHQWYHDTDGSPSTTGDRVLFGDTGASADFVYDGTGHWLDADHSLWYEYDGSRGIWQFGGGNQLSHDYTTGQWWDYGSGTWHTVGDAATAGHTFHYGDSQWTNLGGGYQYRYDGTTYGYWDANGDSQADCRYTCLTGQEGWSDLQGGTWAAMHDLTTPDAFPSFLFTDSSVITSSTSAGTADTTLLGADTGGPWVKDAFQVTKDGVNDAPVNAVPGSPVTFEGSYTFTGNLAVSDPDAGTDPISVTLTAGHGNLTLGSTAGLTVTGDGTHTVVVEGDQSAINAALNGMTYAPDSAAVIYAGADTIQVVTSDLGHNGTGGILTDTDTFDLNVNLRNVGGVDYWVVNMVTTGAYTAQDRNEIVYGTTGDDAIVAAGLDSGYIIYGRAGNDYIWLGYYAGDTVHHSTAYGDVGSDHLYVKGNSHDNVLMGHDSTTGTAGDTSTDTDYLYACNHAYDNKLRGGGGNDTIYLGANSGDAVHGNSAYGDAGADTLLVQYNSYSNVLMGHDSTTGTAGDTSSDADYLQVYHNASHNTLSGGGGNDLLLARDTAFSNVLNGNDGSDTLRLYQTASLNTLSGGAGNDVVTLGMLSGDAVHHNTVFGDGGADALTVQYDSHDNVLMGHDSTSGTVGDTSTDADFIYAYNTAYSNTLRGGGGNDYLWLGYLSGDAVHNNTAYGDAGNDTLYVKGDSHDNVLMGHDSTTGTAGDTSTDTDSFFAFHTAHTNTLSGGGGNDSLWLGYLSDDAVHHNTAYGDAGSDTLYVKGNSHDNLLMGHDSSTGTAGDTSTDGDSFYGFHTAYNNTLSGGGGSDSILLGASLGDAVHHNIAYGDAGADTLVVQYDSHDNVLMGHNSTTGTAGDTSTDTDYIYAANNASHNTLSGGGGNDLLLARDTAFTNVLNGNDGGDTLRLYQTASYNTLSGGAGSDELTLGMLSGDAVHHNTAYGDGAADTFKVQYGSHDNVLMGHDSTTGTAGDTSTDADLFYAYNTVYNNTLSGGGGNDYLWLGYTSGDAVHHNTAYGDAGADTLYVKGNSHDNVLLGHDSTTGTAGDTSTNADTFFAFHTAYNNTLSGGGGSDTLWLGYTAGDAVHHNTAYGDAGADALSVKFSSHDNFMDGGAGNDIISSSSTATNTLNGGSENDTITGSDLAADVLNGGAGNDTISGLGGNDTIDAGTGTDLLYGGAGADLLTLHGTGGVASGGDDVDVLYAVDTAASNTLNGDAGDDTLYALGTASNNAFSGGAGNDNVYLGINSGDAVHHNTAYGDAGADNLYVEGTSHDNVLMGHDSTTGTGGDTSTDADSLYAYNNANHNTLSGGGGIDTLRAYNTASYNVLNGNNGADRFELYNTTSYNALSGGAGNDKVYLGYASGDAVHHNTAYGDGGGDYLYVQYDSHDNVLMGHDSTTGTGGDTSTDADNLYAYNNANHNTLSGGGGGDALREYNTTSFNALNGNDGVDYFWLYNTTSYNTLSGGAGNDWLYLGTTTGDAVHHNTAYGDAGADMLVVQYSSHDNLVMGHDSTTGTGGDTSTDADQLEAWQTSHNNTLSGGGGNDAMNLYGTSYSNILHGDAGVDSIRVGMQAGDAPYGNTAYGDAGADNLYVQLNSHDNVLMGHDSTTGTAGDTSTDADNLYAYNNANHNTLSGGGGIDTLRAYNTASYNVLNGNNGADRLELYNTTSYNTLSGGAGNDTVYLGYASGDAVHHNTAYGDGGGDYLYVQYDSHDNVLMGHDSTTGTGGDTSTDWDNLYAYNNANHNTLSGGGGGDSLYALGTASYNVLNGNDGPDLFTLSDAASHNTVIGGQGFDYVEEPSTGLITDLFAHNTISLWEEQVGSITWTREYISDEYWYWYTVSGSSTGSTLMDFMVRDAGQDPSLWHDQAGLGTAVMWMESVEWLDWDPYYFEDGVLVIPFDGGTVWNIENWAEGAQMVCALTGDLMTSIGLDQHGGADLLIFGGNNITGYWDATIISHDTVSYYQPYFWAVANVLGANAEFQIWECSVAGDPGSSGNNLINSVSDYLNCRVYASYDSTVFGWNPEADCCLEYCANNGVQTISTGLTWNLLYSWMEYDLGQADGPDLWYRIM